MKKFVIIVALFLFCAACGVKSNPEYKSQTGAIKAILTV